MRQKSIHASSVIASAANVVPLSVLPVGESGAVRSSGAHPRNAKFFFTVMSVYGAGVAVGVEVGELEVEVGVVVGAPVTRTMVTGMHGFVGSDARNC